MSEGAVEMGLPEAAGSGSLLAGGGPVDGRRSVAEHGQAAVARKVPRPQVRIAAGDQIPLFAGLPDSRSPAPGGVQFERQDPCAIWFAGLRLDEHLRRAGITAPFAVRRLLAAQDWSALRAKYRPGGRRPYDPAAMTGLVLMGLMRGDTSLRQLERLARSDLGVMWVTGGICPDHSVIGRFILLHAAALEGDFLAALTGRVLQATGSDTGTLAGDGTVIAAQASRLGTLKREALAQAAREARATAQAAPDDATAQAEAERLAAAAATLEARIAARQAKGKPADGLSLHPDEPEAVVQPQKDNTYAPSYKPTVLANKARVVVSGAVHPSSETAALAGLLDRAQAHGRLDSLLLDAGFHSDGVLALAAERGIELLCPEGRSDAAGAWTKQSDKLLPKSRFTYVAEGDVYVCPAGERLGRIGRYGGSDGAPGYVLYGSKACGTCPLRAQCTASRDGRRIRRYGGDAAKEAMRAKLASAEARARYRQRQATVEPVFSQLKEVQGLRRFQRRGLAKVRLEFALHLAAYNLSRVVALAPQLAGPAAALEALLCLCATMLLRLVDAQRTGPGTNRPRLRSLNQPLAAA
jgi:transposase